MAICRPNLTLSKDLTMTEPLTESEVTRFHQNGYVVPDYALPAETINELNSALEETIAFNPSVRPEHLVSVHIDRVNDEGVRGHNTWLELAHHPEILDRVEQLIGPDIVLWGCQVFCKPASDGMEVPMHQDGHYWPIEPLATCTAWIAIDDSNVGNGCLRVVPGSHTGKRYYEHSKSDRQNLVLNQHVDDTRIDLDDAVDIELHPGQFSLHDVFLIHGSNPNTSGKRRAGVAIRYMPATSHFNRSLYETSQGSGYLVNFATRPLWLLRGKDRGNNNFQIGH